MARWSEAKFNEIVARGRCDGEYHSHSAKSIEHWLSSSGHLLYRLRDCCTRITSGHTPLRHDLAIGNVFFVTVECVSPSLINYELTKKVETEHYTGELNRVALDEASVVVTIKRRIAQASPCYNLKGQTVVNQDVAVLRLREGWNPGFIAAYLISRYGQSLADRESTEQMNPYLPVNKLGNLLIPHLAQEAQKEIDVLIRKRFEYLADSENAYTEAQHCLESELGLDKMSAQKPVGYTASFSELEQSRRLDAQHYQSQFSQLLAHLTKFQMRKVRDIRSYNRRGFQPVYVADGAYGVINSQHLGPKHIDYDGLQKTSAQAFTASPEAHIRPNDLLIYTTGAYIGRTNVYLSDAPAFASNHVNILRIAPEIDAAYVAMVFQSKVGQFQTQKHARGSAQAELYPNDIDKFVVPILPPEVQKTIGDLVRESLEKQRESARLLEQAKTRVEQLIEAAV